MTLTYTTIKVIRWCALKPLVSGVRPLDTCIRFAPVQCSPLPPKWVNGVRWANRFLIGNNNSTKLAAFVFYP